MLLGFWAENLDETVNIVWTAFFWNSWDPFPYSSFHCFGGTKVTEAEVPVTMMIVTSMTQEVRQLIQAPAITGLRGWNQVWNVRRQANTVSQATNKRRQQTYICEEREVCSRRKEEKKKKSRNDSYVGKMERT